MRTDYIDITAEGVQLKATLRAATNGDNMRKSILQAQAKQFPQADYADQVVAYEIFPRCVACVTTGTISMPEPGKESDAPNYAEKPIQDLTAAEFISLPTEIGEAWLTLAIKLTPSWDLRPESEDASAEKKG